MSKLVILGLLFSLIACTETEQQITKKIVEKPLPSPQLLSQQQEQVTKLRISYNASPYKRHSVSLTKPETSTFKQLINIIANTKMKAHKQQSEQSRQVSAPKYQLAITYANGDIDYIDATETGEYLYRIIDKQDGYIGGHNKLLTPLINQLVAQKLQPEKAQIEIVKADFKARPSWKKHSFAGKAIYLSPKKSGLSNGDLLNVAVQADPNRPNRSLMNLKLSFSGTHYAKEMTRDHIKLPIAVIVAGDIIMAPILMSPLSSPEISISAVNNIKQSQQLADDLIASIHSPTLNMLKAIPSDFLGEWQKDRQECGNKIAVNRMLINPQQIIFHESQGIPTAISDINAKAKQIHLALKMNGEGEQWQADHRWQLSADKQQLTDFSAISQVTRHRCQ